ncbi:hypothetical protein J7431_01460 [Xanthomonas phaseoli pv. dieffenbachiae]|uniref:hypothetical protein n=1 Tax=Xanthomonas TaxID=338 RepID=UPI0006E60AEA|nr:MULTISPECIES: hypothetical protein [Xanthomonas]MBO9745977.1 hypothetical protein [Xanthomonas phaseoli pv. dieffenbachiae]MBO9751812.1 hypothetical protein [Xanthomonas phaseoli pv. dieffenbachiae]MBO9888954.1 hypothetical protein [Xanthomonas sp. D-36-1]OQP83408.1 hypothetical protein IB69_000100 [Xanthomonas citri]
MKTLPPILLLWALAPAAHALDAAQWQAVAPALQAAIECHAKPDTSTAGWEALPRDRFGGIAPIKPPSPFSVFGLPVTEVSVSIDPEGVEGDSYTAKLASTTQAIKAAAKLDAEGRREATIGTLELDDIGQLSCVVLGAYSESDFQPED